MRQIFSFFLSLFGSLFCHIDPYIGFIEAGFDLVYFQCVNFLVDTYGPLAASAVSANTILRSILACGLAVAARPMFTTLGVPVASSILGAVSVLALPIPLLFMRYHGVLRARSKMTCT